MILRSYAKGKSSSGTGTGTGARAEEDGRSRSSTSPQSKSKEPRRPWQKLLYIKQTEYPDNHVDSKSFLSLIKKNANVRPRKYWKVVGSSGRVTQQISVVFIFVALYQCLSEMNGENEAGQQLFSFTSNIFVFWSAWGALVSFILFLLYTILPASPKPAKIPSTLLSGLLFTGVLAFMTPILKNLTKDISTDSIWALTLVMLVANLLFHNYGSHATAHTKFPDSISINAAMFAAVLLASRLDSNPKVSLLMLAAVGLFALLPIWRRCVRRSWMSRVWLLDASMALVLCSIATRLLLLSSAATTRVAVVTGFLMLVFGITFFCPALMVRLQRYKHVYSDV